MRIKSREIASILRQEIEKYEPQIEVEEVGTVLEARDGIAIVHGVRGVMANEMLEFPNSIYGLALNLEEDNVGCVIMGDYTQIEAGNIVKRTGRIAEVPVGAGLLGRVVNPLGQPMDGKGPINPEGYRPIEWLAPGVVQRQPVKEPLQTGI